jgi:ParB-like chromosome segregation protein Spo0J
MCFRVDGNPDFGATELQSGCEVVFEMNSPLDATNLDPKNFCGSGLAVHPVADIFPLMEGRDFFDLCEDIAARGLQNPIVVLKGVILDGRNRLRACATKGVEPSFAEYSWQPDAEDEWILSQNIFRRSLNPDQRAAILAKAFNWREQHQMERLAKIAAGRLRKKGGEMLQVNSPAASNESPAARNQTRARISKEAGISDHKAKQVVFVAKNQPGLLDAVATGKTTLKKAEKTARKRTKKPRAAPRWRLETAVRRASKYIQGALQRCPHEMRREFLSAIVEAARNEITK